MLNLKTRRSAFILGVGVGAVMMAALIKGNSKTIMMLTPDQLKAMVDGTTNGFMAPSLVGTVGVLRAPS